MNGLPRPAAKSFGPLIGARAVVLLLLSVPKNCEDVPPIQC
jgi:hypothetical protein